MPTIPWLLNEDFYNVLGLERSATVDEIQACYNCFMGDSELSKSSKEKITCCYQILRDKEKRKIYDKHGLPGVFVAETQGIHSYRIYDKYVFTPLYCSGICWILDLSNLPQQKLQKQQQKQQ